MATAIPLALDGGVREPKVVVHVILLLWKHGNQRTEILLLCLVLEKES